MAQIIKNRRGSLDSLASATGSLQKGEILIATGSSKLTGVTNGQGLVFAAVESGSVVASNRVLQGATAPIFSASAYGTLMDGVPFYASSSNTLVLLKADGNVTPDLSSNINTFSSSVSTSFASLSQSVASVTGDFSSSVATSFSASNASITALSASTYEAVFGFAGLSSSIETDFSSSKHFISDLSASIYQTDVTQSNAITANSQSAATSFSASNAAISSLSASVASVTGDFSSSVATSFSASNANITSVSASLSSVSGAVATTISNLSSSIATTDATQTNNITTAQQSADGAFASASAYSASAATSFSASLASQTALSGAVATTISNLSSSIATTDSASNAAISSLSASVASVTGDFSSSVATSFSASAASQTALSGAVATTITNLSSSVATSFSASAASTNATITALSTSIDNRLDAIEFLDTTFATTGSNIFQGTQTITGSLYITQDLVVYGSSSLQNITASAASLGTNTIILNTADPAFRFGGISVIDSGSQQNTGSLFWDSEREHWIYERSETGSYGSAILIAGPKNTGSLGQESELTVGYIPVAVGGDHIDNSNISLSGSKVTIAGDLDATGNISSSTISGIGNVTLYSQSVDSRVASLETSVGAGGAIGTRVTNLETISASYLSFTQSYYSDSASFQSGIDTVAGNLNTLSSSVATDFSASKANVTNLSASIATTDSASAAYAASQLSSVSGAVATTISNLSSSVATSFSSSYAYVTNLSASIATSDSASNAEITALSASVASVGGTFSASVATDFSASNAARVALSASIVSDVNTLSQSFNSRIVANDFLDSTYATTGSNVFKGDQVLTGSFSMTGTANFNNAVAVNDSNMNLGNSSSLNLTGGSSIYVAGAGVISGSIVGIGNVSEFSTSVDSRLDTIETSLGGGGSLGSRVTNLETISSSYLSFTQSYYSDSSSFDTRISSSKAEYTSYSASAATSFSASLANVTSLSASIYQTDATQSANITTAQQSADGAFASASAYSASAATSFSASLANVTQISASIAIKDANQTANISNLYSDVANVFASASAYSASAATQLNSVSGAFATSTSASNAAIASLSASVASTTGNFSSSVNSRLVAEEFKSTTFATTGSNKFVGVQEIVGDVIITGSLTVQAGYDLNTRHIVGNSGYIELGNIDNDIHIQSINDLFLVGSGSGVHVHDSNFSVAPTAGTNALEISASITKVLNAFSASNISGVGNIGAFSQSVDQRLVSLVNFQNTASTALSFDGVNVTVLGDLKVNGNTTQIDSTTVNIGDNIISLNGTGGMFGGIQVKDPTSPNTISGSLLWNTTTDRWIAGPVGSEVNILLASGDNVVSSSSQITLSSTTGFTAFDNAISTSFSASAAAMASVTGDFSSSVATSFSASNASIASLSASVASVTGDFSASVATSFSASAFNVNALSASIYQTDVTQSVAINDNSSSFATSISASNFRITVLETTIDGGSF